MAVCSCVRGCTEVAQLVLLITSTVIWSLSSVAGLVLYGLFIRGFDYGFSTPCWLFGIAGLIFHVTAIVYLFTKNRVLKGVSDFFFIVYIVGAGGSLLLFGYTFLYGPGFHLIATVLFFLGALVSVFVLMAFFILHQQQMISNYKLSQQGGYITPNSAPPPYGQLQNVNMDETAHKEKYEM